MNRPFLVIGLVVAFFVPWVYQGIGIDTWWIAIPLCLFTGGVIGYTCQNLDRWFNGGTPK